jgi:hypothetical protein
MTTDEPIAKPVLATAVRELIATGLTGDELVLAIARIEMACFAWFTRVTSEITKGDHKTKHADYMRQWRASKAASDSRLQLSPDLLAMKPIEASLAPRAHNPLGQKSGHIARRPDVTRTIMGDPEPGRSALDRRKG